MLFSFGLLGFLGGGRRLTLGLNRNFAFLRPSFAERASPNLTASGSLIAFTH